MSLRFLYGITTIRYDDIRFDQDTYVSVTILVGMHYVYAMISYVIRATVILRVSTMFPRLSKITCIRLGYDCTATKLRLFYVYRGSAHGYLRLHTFRPIYMYTAPPHVSSTTKAWPKISSSEAYSLSSYLGLILPDQVPLFLG